MARLSFIATRVNGVEKYKFAGLPNVFHVVPAEHGAYDVGVIRWPTRREAVADVFATAQFLLERRSLA